MPKSKWNSFRHTQESRPSPKPLVVDDVTSLIGFHPRAKSHGFYSSVHHSAPASTCGFPRSSIELRQRWVSPEVFCRPAYTMVASSATHVKEKSIKQEEEDDESDVESSSEDTAFTGLVFLPTARFTAGLPALGTASPALLTTAVMRDRTSVLCRPKSTPLVRYQARTAERASCFGRTSSCVEASHSRMTRKAAACSLSVVQSAAICPGSKKS
jgi:hypothetical protein